MPETRRFRIWRGDPSGGRFAEYDVNVEPGMVVLDGVHQIQRTQAPDLACRWNCKAAKCGSCGAEVNGRPRLMCKTRLDDLPAGQAVCVEPIKTFPLIRDLVTDVSWNFEVNKKIPPFTPKNGTDWVMFQEDMDRVQEFRKCIECFLCQNVCHVLRNHGLKDQFFGPRFFVRIAGVEMHPKDALDRRALLKDAGGLGLCNITKCCTEVCPEDIHITDNAIIPLKERVVDKFYDPLGSRFAKKDAPPAAPPTRAQRGVQSLMRGVGSLLLAAYAVVLVWFLRALSAGRDEYTTFLETLNSKPMIAFHCAALAAAALHAVTWFETSAGDRRVGTLGRWLFYAVWLLATLFVFWLLGGGGVVILFQGIP